ncbi:exodeoxyribonuclease III [Levilactobacillus bambusae]|uniref:Exodeoxyribonuclease III n=1 Tax=Levilactobacillus bambusae TaxID=2024736 RepID=A0A2V1MWN8_9LACO|nr:exodeoxyribonuclease III [Levilactobacillus bambusae]PWF99458.1 exodeoxyribonuclease III [Levilactobacillus bambusae]
MKLLSWNVNGLRAIVKKGFNEVVSDQNPDIMGIQETKLQAGQLDLTLPGYHQYYNDAERKGYSGTAVFTKAEPLDLYLGIHAPELEHEGRTITLEYPDFYFITCYAPNSGSNEARMAFRMDWDTAFQAYLNDLDTKKPVILCGDLNVAHQDIDLKHPDHHRGDAGFTDGERHNFSALLQNGFIDTFRTQHPDLGGAYSWWDYRYRARQSNAGWRIDYFVTSERLLPNISKTAILPAVMGSDHCPVELDLQGMSLVKPLDN